MHRLILIIISTVLVNNFVMARFLGICPFLGVSKEIETSIGMGLAVIFVMTLSTPITWLIHNYLLIQFNIVYLQTVVFILVIAAFVQLVEMIIQKISPVLYHALGIYLPLITTNCAVLGVAVLTVQSELNFLETTIFAFGAAVGFTLALVIFAGIRERLELSDIPSVFIGTAISLITAGLLSLTFLGFAGLVKL